MRETAISLALDNEEKDLVREILEERQRTLLMEISHTDHHDFKVVLRRKAEVLESVLHELIMAA